MQTGHLGTAAEWLQLPVGDVDATLKDAEQQLGFMLFASVRGRLQATRETLELQAEITRFYEALEPLQRLASRLKHPHAPPLRVTVLAAPGQSTAAAKPRGAAPALPGHAVQPVQPADPGHRQEPVTA